LLRTVRSLVQRLFPRGSGVVGAWLLVSGLGAYAFLALVGRVIGPGRYGAMSVLWSLGFVATGCLFPVEQELARAISDRNARGVGSAPVARNAALIAIAIAAVLIVAALVGSGPLVTRLFDDQALLFAGLILLIGSYVAEHVSRGVLSGHGRFDAYGRLVGIEAIARLVGATALVLIGVRTAGPYGIVLGLAAFVGVAGAWIGQRGLLGSGPPSRATELSRAIGWLVASSLFSQILINGGPVVVQLLAGPRQRALAGQYLAGLVVARVPIFFFQAIQASFVPELASLAACGDRARVRADLCRLLLVIVSLGVTVTLGMGLVGPVVVHVAFGKGFALDRIELALLAAGSATYLVALTLSQGLIALARPARSALGFGFGVLVFVVAVVFLPGDLALRLAIATLVGSAAAATGLGLLLVGPVGSVGVPNARPSRVYDA
jgi:O-antigen/teichoic acid export membrane protein